MKKIAVVGTGYVGLVTGVGLSHIGHEVTCLDIDPVKIDLLQKGCSPIYEESLEPMIQENQKQKRLSFTSKYEDIQDAEIVLIAVGTPQQPDGSANLTYIFQAADRIAKTINQEVTVVVKSTVPVGTCQRLRNYIQDRTPFSVQMVSNPEFLREGNALKDLFEGDRIVIGSDNPEAIQKVMEMYAPFDIPMMTTDLASAEMIKYASNAFLATKISFINEISSICEKVGANVEAVAKGMGMDRRIGSSFLQAGIGYGGSCFPKDTKALVQMAGNVKHQFDLLESVIHVNNKQQNKLVDQMKERFGSLVGKRITILGLAFKPGTDDLREAASLVIIDRLLREGALITAYDPVAMPIAKEHFPAVTFPANVKEALTGAELAAIVTEWEEFKELPLDLYEELMEEAILFDGRNCYSLEEVMEQNMEYYSVGRPAVGHTKSATLTHEA
ncbi:UDP-glucose/GDP-mannose dehydrogenase family protein [Pontibacillus sp. ALD_SL1]|uniref:UDP-glucose dehydrogenase family protein n=1 Tax=Pontibacillus sp. ALD_SL1 TaxID=2777185 RepID=UPI001A9566E3|nr:UDP-glucose/GDP-mannose dehydrogenase family protein [Pontibacillus sp. ALD_SL1]QSS99983.1 UDP-glucose/GDP-mannose dehydrogenase family protein [Pontibacillus sp. ALD_SL1]